MNGKTNVLDRARQELSREVSDAAIALHVAEQKRSDLHAKHIEAGYEVSSAKARLQEATTALRTHDERRGRA